jgi:YfiH family protein
MIEEINGDIRLLRFERLAVESGLAHAVTTKPQNMAPHRGIGRDQAIVWRGQICGLLDVPFERLTSPSQIHGGDSVCIDACDVGRGRDGRDSAVPYVDGLLTNRADVPIIVLSADCPIVVLYDPRRHVVGAVHASWQGTISHASAQLVRQMTREFKSDPGVLLAGICPCAGPCCYEVGRDVYRVACSRLRDPESYFTVKGEKYLFDLWLANQRQLADEGVKPDAIETACLCSICDDRFWSHRRDGETAGRFGLVVALRA